MAHTPTQSIKWIMRAGYGARGAIYVLVGLLALWAALGSGQAAGTKDALAQLRAAPFGIPALWAIGLGMMAYMIWRVVAGISDVEDHGTDAKGLAARGGQVTTGLLHGLIGLSVIGLAMGGDASGGGAEDWTQRVMSMPFGRYLVAVGAVVLAGAGAYYMRKGWSAEYQDHLSASALTTRLDPLLKSGLIIYGLLLILVAVSLGFAALNADPAQAGGLGQALGQLRGMAFGRILLGVAGLGLMAFALYNFVEAGYRVIPKITGPETETLRAHLKAAS